jgi:hypothetical protein
MKDAVSQFAAGCSNNGISIIPPWYKYLKGTDDPGGGCSIQFSFPGDLGAIMLAIIEILLRIGAIAAVGYIIYGGFMYMTSQGEPDKAKAAQTTITNAVVGLVIALLATGIVSFIGGRLL